jgi:hypothetical protein
VEASAPNFPCPCCGHLTFGEPPGSYEICAVCFWEDDAVQLRWPDYRGGANRPSLLDAQRTYAEIGATESQFLRFVGRAAKDEPVDVGWRTIDLAIDRFEPRDDQRAPWPDDRTTLYWWRPTFWRAG